MPVTDGRKQYEDNINKTEEILKFSTTAHLDRYNYQPVNGSILTNLHRVGADDFAIETPGELEGETGLASSGGTRNHYHLPLGVGTGDKAPGGGESATRDVETQLARLNERLHRRVRTS